MRFSIERDALTEAVAWVARALPTRPVLPILSGMLLTATASELILACFDYEISARIRVAADVAEPGTVLVPGRLLAEITRSLPAFTVYVDDKGDDVTLTCGAAAFTLVTLPVGEYPQLPDLPVLAGTVDGGVLAAAISQVVPAASRDDTLPILTGVNIELDGGTITLAATDRYRLAMRELAWDPVQPDLVATILTPAKTLADAGRMMAPGTPVQVLLRHHVGGDEHAADAMIGFESGGRRLTTRLIAGEFIKYKSRFPGEFGCCGDMPAAPLAEAVRRVALVAERGTSVRLSFAAGMVTIEAGTEGQARARETVPAQFEGNEHAIAFSPHYLLDGLAAALTAATIPAQEGPVKEGQAEGGQTSAEGGQTSAEGGQTSAEGGQTGEEGQDARIRLQFSSPTKPAVITGVMRKQATATPDFRYLVVPLRALTSALELARIRLPGSRRPGCPWPRCRLIRLACLGTFRYGWPHMPSSAATPRSRTAAA